MEMLFGLISALLFLGIFIGIPIAAAYFGYRYFSKKIPVEHKVKFPKHFAWIVGGLVLALNLFLYDPLLWSDFVPSLMPGLFFVAAAVALFFTLDEKKRGGLAIALTIVGMLAGLAFAGRSSGLVQGLNGLVAFVSLVMLYGLHIFNPIKWEGLWLSRAKWHGGWAFLEHCIGLLKSSVKKRSESNKIMAAVKTTLVTAVILSVFIGLLMAADPVFAQMTQEILDEAVGRAVLSAILALAAVFFLSFRLETKQVKNSSFNILSFNDFAVPSVLLIVLFGVFLSIQGQYLFGAETQLEAFDLTYSEYVRKGFKELLLASFFGGLLNYAIILKQKTEDLPKRVNILKGLNIVLIAELFALLASAFQRNVMYMEVYSLSRMRIIGLVILAWLAIFLLALLVVNVVKNAKESWFFASMGSAGFLCVLLLNVLNVDLMVAEATPPENNHVDYFYVSMLSEDAAAAWPEAIKEAHQFYENIREKEILTEEEITRFAELKLALKGIQGQINRTQEETEMLSNLLHFNSGRTHAWEIYRSNYELFEEVMSCTFQEMLDYQLTHDLSLSQDVNHRLFSYEYPLTSVNKYRYTESYSILAEVLKYDEAEWPTGNHYTVDAHLQENENLMAQFQAAHVPESCPSSY